MSIPSNKSISSTAAYPPHFRPEYATYKSPHGPQYKAQTNFHGIDATRLRRFGWTGAMFAGAIGIGGLYFISGIPRVRIDILQNVPVIGDYFVKKVDPEDNPF